MAFEFNGYLPTFNVGQGGFSSNNTNFPALNQIRNNNFVRNGYCNTNPTMKGLNSDTVILTGKPSTKSSNDKTIRNVLIGLGATAIAVAGGILGHHAIQVNKLNKAFKAIDTKFAKLEQNLPEVQSKFQEIFRRKNLTLEQTKEMLAQYKNLERMRIDKNVSNQDYIRNVFDVASKNYGLENGNIKLTFSSMKGTSASGDWWALKNQLRVKSGLSKEQGFSIIHHELRHAKQTQEVVESFPKENNYYKKLALNSYNDSASNKMTMEQFEKEVWTPDFAENIISIFNRLKRTGVQKSAEDISFAKKCLNAQSEYKGLDENIGEYWKNFLEKDARNAESVMNELFGLNKSRTDYYKKMDAQYLRQ